MTEIAPLTRSKLRIEGFLALDAAGAFDAYGRENVVHRMQQPVGDDDADRRDVAFGGPIAADSLAGLTVDTGGL